MVKRKCFFIQNYRIVSILAVVCLLSSCYYRIDSKSDISNDSIAVMTESDCTLNSSITDDDWIPNGFHSEHPDEWAVVKPAISIWEEDFDKINFDKIDKLVIAYVKKKRIFLPTDVPKRIKAIEDICKNKFDISGYDESNIGMGYADATCRLFEMYINWLYEKEATKVLSINKLVDMKTEQALYKSLNKGMFDVCDLITNFMEGTGRWAACSQIDELFICFNKYMYMAIIGEPLEKLRELNVPLNLFDKECTVLIENYEPEDEDLQPKDASFTVCKFQKAFHSWFAYRKSVASALKDAKFKKAYESITYHFARTYFLHLKNRFSDIGWMNDFMVEVCLENDCSDKELMEFNFEKKREELLGYLRISPKE